LSVPYETAAYEPAESPESPEEHLARLLGRALNSFELPDEVIRRLDCALAHDSSLYSAHHSAGLHRETYRHTWLLADGSAVTLWELELPSPIWLWALPTPRHVFASGDCADHVRRLLCRAENPDRPDARTAALLATATAHEITQAFGRPGRVGRSGLSYVLYEHAFLLPDGSEAFLWEVEHTATPDGRHMCEVYTSEEAARSAMERRAARQG